MTDGGAAARIPLQLMYGCLIASLQVELDEQVLRRFRSELLERLKATAAHAVILDVSGVELMDLEEFDALRRSLSMAEVMGAQTILVGLGPGIVSALVELGADVDGLRSTLDLETALAELGTRGGAG